MSLSLMSAIKGSPFSEQTSGDPRQTLQSLREEELEVDLDPGQGVAELAEQRLGPGLPSWPGVPVTSRARMILLPCLFEDVSKPVPEPH